MAIAQLNIGRLIADPNDSRVADFMDAIERINNLGKSYPGFIWIMEGSSEPALGNTETKIDNDPRFISNMTMWRDFDALEEFAFKSEHVEFFKRRLEWFEPFEGPSLVIWPVEADERPSLAEGLDKLEYLKNHGDTPEAYGLAYARKNR